MTWGKAHCAWKSNHWDQKNIFETIEEGPLEIDFMQVTNDIEKTFYQTCTKFKTQIDLLLSEEVELIKTQKTLRRQIN